MQATGQNVSAPTLATPPTALALSGGGLRAALFQQGCFVALALREELEAIHHVGAISGGTLAALVLRQAHADVAHLASPPATPLERQLSVVAHAEWHLSRLASRNIRSRALLSWKSVGSAVAFGALNLTRRFAEDINRTLGKPPRPQREPFTLRIGVHDLAHRRAAHVEVGPHSDVGMVAAAAMSIPGLMESVVIPPTMGPVCDGGVDDKTAFQLLLDAGHQAGTVLVLDASTDATLGTGSVATPMASLMALMERNSEALRASHAGQPQHMAGWVSLRDAHEAGCGLNKKLLGFLQRARTDLNHFSRVEQLALAAVGFILTLHARGESRADILHKAALLGEQKIAGPRGLETYPLAGLFEGVCRSLLDAEEALRPASLGQRVRSWGRSTISESLDLILEKSARSLGRDVRSKHAFHWVTGILGAGWGLWIFASCLVLLAVPAWIAIAQAGHALHVAPWGAAGWLWVLCGLVLTLAVGKWARSPEASWVGWRLVAGVLVLPALVPLALAVRVAVLAVHEGEAAWSLRYRQSTLGRVRGIFSIRDIPRHAPHSKPAFMYVMLVLLAAVCVFNPFWVGYLVDPGSVNGIWHFDALGVEWLFRYSPVQPALLALLALEGLVATFFAVCKRRGRAG